MQKFGRAAAPKPFPGKRYPTRVAWDFEFVQVLEDVRQHVEQLVVRRQRESGRTAVEILRDPDIVQMCRRTNGRRLRYIGKPNRYRALQAQRFLQRRAGEMLKSSLEVEFDRNGIMFSRHNGNVWVGHVHTAYHPHSGTLGPIDSFARKIYRKRVGGLTLYSYKDKLTQDELDSFYDWYERAFRKKLRRPRGKAAAMSKPAEIEPAPAPPPVPEGPEGEGRVVGCICWQDDQGYWVREPGCPRHGDVHYEVG